jgi:hypothetical protein
VKQTVVTNASENAQETGSEWQGGKINKEKEKVKTSKAASAMGSEESEMRKLQRRFSLNLSMLHCNVVR